MFIKLQQQLQDKTPDFCLHKLSLFEVGQIIFIFFIQVFLFNSIAKSKESKNELKVGFKSIKLLILFFCKVPKNAHSIGNSSGLRFFALNLELYFPKMLFCPAFIK